MKPEIKHILKSQMKTGVTPTPSNVDLAHAFQTFNEIGSGLNIGYDDISYKDMKIVSMIENVKNELQQKKLKEAQMNG